MNKRRGILEFGKQYLHEHKDNRDAESLQICHALNKLFDDLSIHYYFLSIEEKINYIGLFESLYITCGDMTYEELAGTYYMELSMTKRFVRKCNDTALDYIIRESGVNPVFETILNTYLTK